MHSQKPILILQLRPEDAISESEYGCILRYGQIAAEATRRLRIEATGIPADLSLDDFSAIIVGGSPFDITTPEEHKSRIQRKIESDFDRLLAGIVVRDFPFLGACSGNGLLGRHLGASISRRYREPVSRIEVELTEAASRDQLLQGLPRHFDVLVGHKEACDRTPAAATLLITGRTCPVQMFRVGNNVYATQFHPEGDPEEFTRRIHAYKHHGYFRPDEAEALMESIGATSTPYAQEILRRFVALYAAQGSVARTCPG